jgi:SHS2 domain-containing protein
LLTAWCRYGEKFDLARHPQGTEVKAITYSNMQVLEREVDGVFRVDVFVIVDI